MPLRPLEEELARERRRDVPEPRRIKRRHIREEVVAREDAREGVREDARQDSRTGFSGS